MLRSKFDNEISFHLGGDFNRLNISSILNSYGALKQSVTVPTRKNAILEIIISDLSTLYHPPTTVAPLQVDKGKKGEDSDHNILIFAPLSNQKYKIERNKKYIKVRPIPDSQILNFENEIISTDWNYLFNSPNIDEKTQIFHDVILHALNKYFPEKSLKVSNLDKKWMNPKLKSLHRNIQREYYSHRRSEKWRKLKTKFKREKRNAIKSFYSKFVHELKATDPRKWYGMAKRIGAVSQSNQDDIQVESLKELSNKDCAKEIAKHYAKISNEYHPVTLTQLPCFLPANRPPQVEQYIVCQKIAKLKKTRSTLPIDIPHKLRKACSVELAGPLTNIINACLKQGQYPQLWKYEWVTPVPKVTNPLSPEDLRKISGTSDYSKIFEGFVKGWIIADVYHYFDIGQFGGQTGTGVEHMLVCMLDRILRQLDAHPNKSAVIAASLDWSAAFDRQDPTLAIKKFIQIGVRSSLIPLLISYLSNRQMKVKFNGEESEFLTLSGGGPQGTLLGQIEYLALTNDNAASVPELDRFKYIDDLTILELVSLAGLLTNYNFKAHIASDIGIEQTFLPTQNFESQAYLDNISAWSTEHLVKLNEQKCKFMIFSRAKEDFMTRQSCKKRRSARSRIV